MEKEGRAYAFVDCVSPIREIEENLSVIRECAQTPADLELRITTPHKINTNDEELIEIIEEAKRTDKNYVFEATLRGATNRKTADELADIMIYLFRAVYEEKGIPFRGEIRYEEGGKYLFRR